MTDSRQLSAHLAYDMQRYRPVARHVVHPQPLAFRTLAAAAIPSTTRFIVLDVDRTLHFARNMGEYMGWEMCAYHHYGGDYLDAVEHERDTSRFLSHWREPVASSRYFLRGCRVWAYPGLFYLLWGRMASGSPATQRLRHRRFGAEPYSAIQSIPTIALLHELSGTTVDIAAHLADRLLDRFAGDEVIDRDDVEWLRERCPNARIILSSASPRPTVEATARRLGIDDWECTEIEIHRARFSAPFQLGTRYLRTDLPHRVSPPSRYVTNAGRAKVRRLLTRYPGLAEPGAEAVGITDTWHGEDHSWAEHFSRVIDVNSTAPFPPLVVANSPLEAIHSAQVLTRHERARRADGDPDYVDPRRAAYFRDWRGGDLGDTVARATVDAVALDVERLAARRARLLDDERGMRSCLTADIARALANVEEAVYDYNAGVPADRRTYLRAINRTVRAHDRLVRELARTERAASEVALAVEHRLAAARAALATPDAAELGAVPAPHHAGA